MAHELEHAKSMVYVGETPWHQLGVKLDTPPATGAEMMRAAGMDWRVTMENVYLAGADDMLGQRIPGSRAVVRETDGKAFGVVSDKWRPIQNVQAFELFDPLVTQGFGTYETAGSLRGGSVVWVLAKLAESFRVIGDDVVDSYLLFTNSFDGKSGARARYTPTRVVCMNTLQAALSGFNAAVARAAESDEDTDGKPVKRRDAMTIRHIGDTSKRMEEVQKLMGFAVKTAQQTAESFQAMARLQLQSAEIMDFIAEVLPNNPDAENHKRNENMRAEIMRLIDEGVGSDLPGVRGTLWGTLNAVSEYYQHSKGVSVSEIMTADGRVKAEKHLAGLWLPGGTAHDKIARATDLAMKRLG